MQLRRAKVQNLHGIFTKAIDFHPDYTFLHGINGTGKTSLLRALQSLTQPDIEWLVTNKFDFVEVWLTDISSKIRIRCEKSENTVTLKLRIGNEQTEEVVDITNIDYVVQDQARKYDVHERDNDVVESAIYDAFSASNIIKYIQNLPTPIFLGLNRTSAFDPRRVRPAYDTRTFRGQRVRIIGQDGSLAEGMSEAIELVQSEAKEVARRKADFERKLRNDISFLMFSDTSGGRETAVTLPKSRDIVRYRKMKTEIINTLSQIGFEKEQLSREVASFFDPLVETARYLSQFEAIPELFSKINSDKEASKHFYFWFGKQQLLPLIDKYFSLVEKFSTQVLYLRANTAIFEDIVNHFFIDSGKSLKIGEVGNILISNEKRKFELGQLSSGEKQILVLISHLVFNPRLRKANVLIIDEPELSLHVRWQEIFVESVRKANSNTQLILATHSPSIVLDHRDKMVNLNGA